MQLNEFSQNQNNLPNHVTGLRDCRQIPLVTLNGSCPLSKDPPQPPVLNRQNQDGQNTNEDQMKNSCPFYIVFQVLKVLFINISKIKTLDLLILVAFISFYIRRYQSLELYSTLSEKKISVTNFPFLTDSLNHPHPHPLTAKIIR